MKVSFYTLGCKVNQYETEMLKEKFGSHGWEIVGEEEYADAYVINTCTVTNLADRKSRQYIRRMKKKNPEAIVAVTGCYAQISPEEVAAIEGVEVVVGINEKAGITDMVTELYQMRSGGNEEKATSGERNAEEKCETVIMKVRNAEDLTEYEETGLIEYMESRTRAYIKVQEGCNRFCSYCIIPYARGKVRSRQPMEIYREAESLISNGYKEIILTGINTALYGAEDNFNARLSGEHSEIANLKGIELIIALISKIDGDFRIRLSSLEPTVINKDYVAGLLKYEKLCHHLHLSLQSGSDKILKAMNRRYDRREYLEIAKLLREFDMGYGITTDVIVGFPTETEKDFCDSIEVVEKAKVSKVHTFKYSKRAGTKAALLSGQVSPEIKKERSARMIEVGTRVALDFHKLCEGREEIVLIEEYDEDAGCFSGYGGNYIKVYIEGGEENSNIIKDSFVKVRLTTPYRDGVKAIMA